MGGLAARSASGSECVATSGTVGLSHGSVYRGGLGNGRGAGLAGNEVFKVVVEHAGLEFGEVGVVAFSEVIRVLHRHGHDGRSAVGDAGEQGKSNFGRHVD